MAVSSDERWRPGEDDRQAVSGQWRAMPDGIDGIHGNDGNAVSVNYRFQRGWKASNPTLSANNPQPLG